MSAFKQTYVKLAKQLLEEVASCFDPHDENRQEFQIPNGVAAFPDGEWQPSYLRLAGWITMDHFHQSPGTPPVTSPVVLSQADAINNLADALVSFDGDRGPVHERQTDGFKWTSPVILEGLSADCKPVVTVSMEGTVFVFAGPN